MKLDRRILVVVLCTGAAVVSASASSADPAMWLAQARAAIGGEVATESVTSLRIRGSNRRPAAGGMEFSWEALWQAPDKFLQVETRTQTVGPMGNISTTRRSGFNGEEQIEEFLSDLPMPPRPPMAQNKPNALVPMHRRALTQLLLPLLASATPLAAVAPLTIAEPDSSVPARPGLNLVAFAAPDGTQLHLWLDGATHLPSVLSWMDFPIKTTSTMSMMTVTTTTRVPAGQVPPRNMPMLPPPMPQSPPTPAAGGPPAKVPWEMKLSGYKTDKGVTLPRRITVMMGSETWEDMRINRYEVNPKINPKTFQVRK